MLSVKSMGPAPIFNFRKRQRDAVLTNPETWSPLDKCLCLEEKAFSQENRSNGDMLELITNYPEDSAFTCRSTKSSGPNNALEGMSFLKEPVSTLPSSKIRNELEKLFESGSGGALRALTVAVSHVTRLFRLRTSTLPQILFIIFGVIDSTVASDSQSSGKSFVLKDETGSIKCVFCEIDRQMVRVHSGQLYRIVGVVKPNWKALHCLSLRTVGEKERKRAVASMTYSTQLLQMLLSGELEQ